ncbi:MAG: tRNA (guanosine(46)-N7)-methyltransferase TrmB [Pirellulaceae bacterium]|nr:tRNA (guanosine(46)-N7)-methyltransferase TrmB [Pirellulaceae bacterium]
MDLSHHLHTLTELPAEQSLPELFDNPAAPLEVEVGTGKGLFMRSAAAEHPARNFLGVEIAGKYARFAAAGLAKRGLHNGVMLHGDGLALFADRIPADSLAAVHVYFPDPWWKKRHHKRRVMIPAFAKNIERALSLGGRLHFWTDVRDYFETALEMLAAETRLAGPIDVAGQAAGGEVKYHTHFERRMRLRDVPIYRAEFARG